MDAEVFLIVKMK